MINIIFIYGKNHISHAIIQFNMWLLIFKYNDVWFTILAN